jgi:DegV family protein with EDD domain
MSSVCILTDNTAHFSRISFPGNELVSVVPFEVLLDQDSPAETTDQRINRLPASSRMGIYPRLKTPGVEDLKQLYLSLSHSFNEIIAIFLSSRLNPLVINAQQAATQMKGRIAVQVIDSQSTSAGLGYLVQVAAEVASKGGNSVEIERLIRGLVPHIYSIFCIPGLTYLYANGFLDYAQAVVGEMLNLLPVFTLEEGHLTSLEKPRNLRGLTDFFQEFLDEFSDVYHIAFIQSVPAMNHESRIIRDFAQNNYPGTPYSEHTINLPLAALLSPRSLGVFVIEVPDNKEK